jgi:adenosylmethionine-8-amino-7-oxononanoate aminotransferase
MTSPPAKRHLWGHFARHGDDITPPIITRGEGVKIWDDKGKSYIDGLSGLFVVQVGHGRKELAEAAAKQAETLSFFPLWSYATPPAIELAERIAGYAPGDLNRVFFTTGGGEAVESAWKLAKQYFKLTGKPGKYKVVSRSLAYHGTPQGACRSPASRHSRHRSNRWYRVASVRPTPTSIGRLRRATPTSRRSAATAPTASPRPSSSRVPTPSQRCSSNPCRTQDASRRRPGTSSGSARSATSTTCCWCPTR